MGIASTLDHTIEIVILEKTWAVVGSSVCLFRRGVFLGIPMQYLVSTAYLDSDTLDCYGDLLLVSI